MPQLQIFHGRIVNLRRHVNMHPRHLHPLAPSDRCELWLQAPDGGERRSSVDTRDMPARRGHAVGLITTAALRPRVLDLVNRTTNEVVNHARREPQGLVRVGDMVWLAVGFVGMTAWLRSAGAVLFVPSSVMVSEAWSRCAGLRDGGWRGEWTGRPSW